MATQQCMECDGVGSRIEFDDGRLISIMCHACEGCGTLEDCERCLCPAPAVEIDRWKACHACHSEMMEMT